MKYKKFYLILIPVLSFLFNCNFTYAQTNTQELPTVSSIEKFLDSITIDLPPSDVSCRASGSLSQIFSKSQRFKSGGNTFFVDKETREIANFQRAIIEEADKKILIQMFIKIPDVERETLVDLLFKKKIVAAKNAQVVFIMKIASSEGESTFINESIDPSGNAINSIVFTKLARVGNLVYKGEKFVTADGYIKIRFPEPPKKVSGDGSLTQVFDNRPGLLVCFCKNCPFHDFDLTDLKDAFDGSLVDDVIQEATSTQ